MGTVTWEQSVRGGGGACGRTKSSLDTACSKCIVKIGRGEWALGVLGTMIWIEISF